MTREAWTVAPDDSVATIAGRLATHCISAAPVCDKDGSLLGMVTEGDRMRPFVETNELRRASRLTLLSEGANLAPEFSDTSAAITFRRGT